MIAKPTASAHHLRQLGLPPTARAATGYAFTTPSGDLIVNSVRETRDATRLAGGEGKPVRVLVVEVGDDGEREGSGMKGTVG